MHLARAMSMAARSMFLLSVFLYSSCAVSKQADSCASIQTDPLPLGKPESLPSSEWGTLSLGSQVNIPFLLSTEYLMDSGPVIYSEQGGKSITYRLIDSNEIKFIGSEKSPSRYFIDVFNNPTGMECALAGSYQKASGKWRGALNGFDVYIFAEEPGYKAYLISSELNFVTELFTNGLSLVELAQIIQNTHIVK